MALAVSGALLAGCGGGPAAPNLDAGIDLEPLTVEKPFWYGGFHVVVHQARLVSDMDAQFGEELWLTATIDNPFEQGWFEAELRIADHDGAVTTLLRSGTGREAAPLVAPSTVAPGSLDTTLVIPIPARDLLSPADATLIVGSYDVVQAIVPLSGTGGRSLEPLSMDLQASLVAGSIQVDVDPQIPGPLELRADLPWDHRQAPAGQVTLTIPMSFRFLDRTGELDSSIVELRNADSVMFCAERCPEHIAMTAGVATGLPVLFLFTPASSDFTLTVQDPYSSAVAPWSFEWTQGSLVSD
ncbi:MAG TPA: hypothetical protein VGP64_18075 [Polyangia bacterium]|jgi:hypothetical protein